MYMFIYREKQVGKAFHHEPPEVPSLHFWRHKENLKYFVCNFWSFLEFLFQNHSKLALKDLENRMFMD